MTDNTDKEIWVHMEAQFLVVNDEALSLGFVPTAHSGLKKRCEQSQASSEPVKRYEP